MKKTGCYITIFTVFSLVFFVYLIPSSQWRDSEARDEGRGRGRGGGGGGGGGGGEEEFSLPFNFPHPVETMTDQLPYYYYEADSVFQREGEVERERTERESALLSHAKQIASISVQRSLSLPELVSGRYRWLPDGLEHDLLFKDRDSEERKRVVLFQKMGQAEVVRVIGVESVKPVHIVIALKGRLEKYITFLHHLAITVLPHDPHITLTVAYFDANTHTLKNITAAQTASFPNFKWSVVPLGEASGPQGFSRGKGLHVGALHATQKDTDLLFFCDVDVIVKRDFFQRCRSNVVFRKQVYYPMVFSLYNPELVYSLQEMEIPAIPELLRVREDTGFWREFGFGMSCVSRGDYDAAGGYLDIRAWGGEDEALYQQFLTKDYLKVIRAPDPSLFHLYHKKECVDSGDAAYVSCLKSSANTEGSRMQLGLTLLKLRRGTDIEGVLSKRFYYFWLIPYLSALLVVSLLTNALLATLLLICVKRKYGCKVV